MTIIALLYCRNVARVQIPVWARGEILSHALIRQKRVFDDRRQVEVLGLARPMELEKVCMRQSEHINIS